MPSHIPSGKPSVTPSYTPSVVSSDLPSILPSAAPTITMVPSMMPSRDCSSISGRSRDAQSIVTTISGSVDANSAQGRAADWFLNTDNTTSCNSFDKLKERYVLAIFISAHLERTGALIQIGYLLMISVPGTVFVVQATKLVY